MFKNKTFFKVANTKTLHVQANDNVVSNAMVWCPALLVFTTLSSHYGPHLAIKMAFGLGK